MSQNTAARDRITEGVIWKEMLLFFLPIMLGTLLQQLYNMADTLIVGRFVGKQALAAVGGASPIITVRVTFFVVMSSGASVIVSQYFGAGQEKNVRSSIQNAMALAFASGALITVVGILTARPLLTLLHTTADTMEYSVEYLRWYFLGMIPAMVYNMGSGILRSMGDSKRPVIFLGVCAVVNIVLDLLLVVVFEMAVMGAALATTLSQVVCAVLVLITLARLPEGHRPDIRHLSVDQGILQRMMRIGLPAGLQSSMYNIANMIIQVAINELGTDAMAGWTAYRKIDDLFWPISSAIAVTIMTFVGQNFGARKMDRMREVIRTGLVYHVSASILFSFIVISARYPLISLFAKGDPAVIACGASVTVYTCLFYCTISCTEVFSSSMRAVGNAIRPALITMVCVCIFRAVYLYGYVFSHLSNLTIALCYPLSWSLASIVFSLYYRSGKWVPKNGEI